MQNSSVKYKNITDMSYIVYYILGKKRNVSTMLCISYGPQFHRSPIILKTWNFHWFVFVPILSISCKNLQIKKCNFWVFKNHIFNKNHFRSELQVNFSRCKDSLVQMSISKAKIILSNSHFQKWGSFCIDICHLNFNLHIRHKIMDF